MTKGSDIIFCLELNLAIYARHLLKQLLAYQFFCSHLSDVRGKIHCKIRASNNFKRIFVHYGGLYTAIGSYFYQNVMKFIIVANQ